MDKRKPTAKELIDEVAQRLRFDRQEDNSNYRGKPLHVYKVWDGEVLVGVVEQILSDTSRKVGRIRVNDRTSVRWWWNCYYQAAKHPGRAYAVMTRQRATECLCRDYLERQGVSLPWF